MLGAVDLAPPGLSRPSIATTRKPCPPGRSGEAVRRVDQAEPDRCARGDAAALVTIAGAEQRHAVERVRERDDVDRLRRDAAAARRARRRARARPGRPSAGASGTSTSRRTARGSGRRTSRPDARVSCVTPETPSSALGRSTPCQWIDTPSPTSRLTSVASTRSPSWTRSSGPGTRPSNVSALTVAPGRQPDLRRLRDQPDADVRRCLRARAAPTTRSAPCTPCVQRRRAAAEVHRPELERAERAGNAARVPGDAEPDDERDDRCESGDEREPLGPRRRVGIDLEPVRQPAPPSLRPGRDSPRRNDHGR